MALSGDVIGRVVVEMVGDQSQLIADFRKAEEASKSAAERMGRAMLRTGTTLSASLSAPMVAFGSLALRTAGNFEQGMNRVRAVTQSTDAEFEALRNVAMELGRTTQFSASQAADAMGFLGMAGFKANEIIEALPSTLQLAAAAGMDLGRAADITTNILTGFGMEINALGHANDVLVAAMTSANVDLQMLGESMKYVGPVAVGAGISFEETAAAIALMGNAGIQGSMAGTSLRGALTRLMNPTKQISDAMERLGIDVYDSSGNLKSLEEIVRELEASGATTADMMLIFGQRAGPAMAALVEQGSDSLGNLTAKLGAAGGVAESVATIQMEGFNGAIIRVKSAWEGLMIAFADAGFLDAAAGGAERLAEFLTRLAETNPELLKLIGIIGGITAAVGPVLATLGAATLAISALSGPVLLVSGGVAALAIAFGMLAVDAEKLPPALRIPVQILQSLAEVAPIAAGGIGALLAAMAASKVAAFALSIRGLGSAFAGLNALIMTPVGGIGMFVAALVTANEVSKAFTGTSLIGHLRGVDHAARGAEEGARAFALAMAEMGEDADPVAAGMKSIEEALGEFAALAAEQGPLMAHMFEATGKAATEYASSVAASIEAMDEHGVSALRLKNIIEELPPEIRDLVTEMVDWEMIQARANGELQDMLPELAEASPMVAMLAERFGLLGDSAAPTVDELAELTAELRDQRPEYSSLADAVDLAIGIIDGFGGALAGARKEVEFTNPMLRTFGDRVAEAASSGEEFKSGIDVVISAVSDLKTQADIDDWKNSLVDDFDAVVKAMGGLAIGAEETFSAWRERMQQSITDHQEFESNLRTIYEALVAAGVENAEEIVAGIAEQGPEAAAVWQEHFIDNPAQALEDAGLLFAASQKRSIEDMLAEWGEYESGVPPVVERAIRDAMVEAEKARLIAEAMATGMALTPEDIAILESKAESNVDALIDAGVLRAADADAVGEAVTDAVGDGIIGGRPTVEDAAGQIPDWIINAASGGNFYMIGYNAALGVAAGIEGGSPEVAAAAARLVTGGIGTMADEIRSESPSKETAEKIGLPMAQGVAVGIEQGTPLTVGAVSQMISEMRERAKADVETFADDFAGALSSAQFRARLEAALGPLGADVMEAIADAMATGRGGESIIRAVERLIDEARKLGIPAADRLGADLMAAVTAAMRTGSAAALAEVEALLIRLDEAINAFTPTVFTTFLDAHRNAQLRAELVALYGELGADIVEAMREALADPTGASGAALYQTVVRMTEDARKLGVANADELGAAIIQAMALAIHDNTPEAEAAVLDTIRALDRAIAEASEEPAKTLIEGFMDGYRKSRDQARLIDMLGSEGARFITALREGMEKEDPKLMESIGDMAYGLIQTLTEGLRPEEGAEIATKFMKLLQDVIREEGDAVIQELIDLLAEIEAANKPNAGKGKEPDNTGTGTKLAGYLIDGGRGGGPLLIDGKPVSVWQGRPRYEGDSGLFYLVDGNRHSVGSMDDVVPTEDVKKGPRIITKKELDDHLASLDITPLATGLPYVPHDGFLASLHEGEAVLPKSVAEEWRSGGNVSVTVNVAGDGDPLKIRDEVMRGINEWKRKELGAGAAQWGIA